MRQVKIIIERQIDMDGPEDVWLATAEELPGFTAESKDKDEIFDLARRLAFAFLQLDGEAAGDRIAFDFEVRA